MAFFTSDVWIIFVYFVNWFFYWNLVSVEIYSLNVLLDFPAFGRLQEFLSESEKLVVLFLISKQRGQGVESYFWSAFCFQKLENNMNLPLNCFYSSVKYDENCNRKQRETKEEQRKYRKN